VIIALDTSTPICKLGLENDDAIDWHEWQADRQLAKGLLGYIQDTLGLVSAGVNDISGIIVFKGPGSFTGLRIGMTVANTLADSLNIPIVGETGENWTHKALERLKNGENDRIVLPDYGSEAHITKPRK
jgi:tRNA threonylcarbamoyladenosine biosynthesis protein TsaB